MASYWSAAILVRQGLDAAATSRAVTRLPDVAYLLNVTRSTLGWIVTQGSVGFSWLLFFYPLSDVMRILRALQVPPLLPMLP